MIVVGITGTIGSGKTFALNFFKSKKLPTFSAYMEVKKLLEKKYVKKKLKILFPEVFINKKLNKRILRSLVFNDKKKLRKLEEFIHPIVGKEKNLFLKKNKKKKIVFLEKHIIFEKKSQKNYDYIIIMNTNKKLQFKRICNRRDMTYDLYKKIISNQISNKKKNKADFVIDNNKSKVETTKILKKTLKKIISTEL